MWVSGNRLSAISFVLKKRAYLIAFLLIAILAFAIYSYFAPNSSINLAGPKVALGLNAYALTVFIAISALLSLSIVMSAFAISSNFRSGSKMSAGAIITSIVPSALCCTPVIPSVLAVLGASTSTIIGVTGKFQGPLATYETLLIAASIGLLLLSIFLVSGNIYKKCCIVRK